MDRKTFLQSLGLFALAPLAIRQIISKETVTPTTCSTYHAFTVELDEHDINSINYLE